MKQKKKSIYYFYVFIKLKHQTKPIATHGLCLVQYKFSYLPLAELGIKHIYSCVSSIFESSVLYYRVI